MFDGVGVIDFLECSVEWSNVFHSSNGGKEGLEFGLDRFDEPSLDCYLEPLEEEIGVLEVIELECFGKYCDLLLGEFRGV